jgi:uncharacterized repeat protein (TIGR01451 family)
VTVTATVAVTAPGAGTPTGDIAVSDGAATCTITLPATTCALTPASAGTTAVTATYAGDANFAASTATTSLIVDPPPSLVVLGGSPQDTTIGTGFAVPLTVQVVDGYNVPLANVEIDFAAPASGPGAVLSATAVNTDANGIASITAVANDEVGSYQVTASSAGVADVDFDLANTAPVVALGISIDDGRGFARYGQTLDYLVTIYNAGPSVAHHVAVDTTLAPQLDAAFTTWICVDAGTGNCSAGGSGTLSDSEVTVPAGASVVYILSAPIRLDAAEPTIETTLDVTSPDQAPTPVSDSTTLVTFRNGFDHPYGVDGTSLDTSLAPGDRWRLDLPAAADTGEGIAVVLLARGSDGAGFRIERLQSAGSDRLRLVQRDADGAEYPWSWVDWQDAGHAPSVAMSLGEDEAQRPVLHLAGIADAIVGAAGEHPAWRVRVSRNVGVTRSRGN